MSSFSLYVSHGSFFFSDLVRSARRGEFVLPAFQRGFVWDEADILKLLDSMWRGYPIGNVLLWENWQGKARAVRPFRGCSEVSRFAPLVLDGQQRIQALIEATAPASGYAYELASDQFVRVEAPTLEAGYVPCEVLVDFISFMESFHAEYEKVYPRQAAVEIPAPTKASRKKARATPPVPPPPPVQHTPAQEAVLAKINIAESVLTAFREVRIASITIPAARDEAFAREVFRRMNSTGKAMTEADVFDCLNS